MTRYQRHLASDIDSEKLFSTPRTCLMPHSGWTPCDINVTYTSLKSAFNGLQFCPRQCQYGSIFIRLAVIASDPKHEKCREIPTEFHENLTLQQFKVIKVIDLGVNGKPICDFLLVINCNFNRIYYRFRDIHAYR